MFEDFRGALFVALVISLCAFMVPVAYTAGSRFTEKLGMVECKTMEVK